MNPRVYAVLHGNRQIYAVKANADGLLQLTECHLANEALTIQLPRADLLEEEQVNFVALMYKSAPHWRRLLQLPPIGRISTSVWRKYFRHRIDAERGEANTSFSQVLRAFTITSCLVDFFTVQADCFTFRYTPPSSVALAAIIGRVENAVRWCVQHTNHTKLVSEAVIRLDTFNKITISAEQPVVRRRK